MRFRPSNLGLMSSSRVDNLSLWCGIRSHGMGLFIALSTLLLSGCNTDPATDLLERYASRTGNAIEVDVDLALQTPAQVYTPLAPRRERLAAVPEIREGLLDLLDLRQCDLMQLVSERNTSLGRVAKPSQRLIYELKILPALNRCIATLADEPEQKELSAKLAQYRDTKRAGFAPLLFNAIYQTDEMERHFSFGQPPLEPQSQGYLAPLVDSLERFALLAQLNRESEWQTPTFTQELESSYERLYGTDFGARWLSSMALLTQTLEQTSSALETRLAGRPICFNRKQNRQSEILWNVFVKFYVGELQPYIALVEREGREWSRLNLEILDQLSMLDQSRTLLSFLSYDDNSMVWGPYLRARERHTKAWQELLEQCDLRPGA